jgi:cell division protein FtsI/penicillin-binding protein 2
MRRIGLSFAVLLMLLSIGVGRALWLGVVDAASLREKAREQQNERVQIPAHRGTIFDRRGTALAISKPAADVLFIPRYIKKSDLPALDRRLTATQRARLRSFPSSDADFRYLLNDVSRKRARSFQYSRLHAVGIYDVPTFRREHPEADLAAGILGGVDREGNGETGLEQALQRQLGGENGERDVLLNALGTPVGDSVLGTPKSGKDVHLTIDARVQALLEDRLARQSGAASAIILDAHSGQIVAMGDAPSDATDPTDPVAAVGRAFEPGSALDAFTVAAALEEGVVTPTETFVLPPAIGSLAIDDSEEEAGTRLSTRQILAQSSDPGTVLVALRLGPSRFDGWMRRFGFGHQTGVELPAERSGLIPSVQASSMAMLGSAPVGRGASVTLVQLATAYASLLNGGTEVEPTLVIGRRGPRHRLLAPVVSIEAAAALQGGSGGEVPRISTVTGTYSSDRADASFVGYVPHSDSMLIVAVFLEAPLGSGESSAQRLFASIRSALASPPG